MTSHSEAEMIAWWEQLPADVRAEIRNNPHGNVSAQAAPLGFATESYWPGQYPSSITYTLLPDVITWVEGLPHE